MPEFDELLKALDGVLAKAMPVDGDQKDGAAPTGGADDDANANGKDDEGEGEGEGEEMMKSFAVTLENGEEVEAYDATAMLKSMHAVAKRQGNALAALRADLSGAAKVIAKQTDLLKAMGDRIAEQADMLKALRNEPAGRRSATAAPKAGGGDMSAEDLLTKALSAQKAGRLTSLEVATVEARLQAGVPIDARVLAAISAA